MALFAPFLASAFAQAQTLLPTGGAYVAGAGSIGSAGATTTINQSSSRGIINWQRFSIGAGGTVNFNNGSGATLNRVTGGNLSSIEGALNATGSVFLVNPNGVVIGPGGTVVTGGSFVASTRDVPNSQFMAGGAKEFSGSSSGSVVNNGKITAGGDVVLIGEAVANNGAIHAASGTAALAAGNEVVLSDSSGPAGVYVAPDAGTGNVTNTGSIKAAAAELAAAGGNVYALAGNRSGLIQATGTRNINGQIWLTAPNGTVSVNATSVAARTASGAGGSIIANGQHVSIGGSAKLSASAMAAGQAGGHVLVGTSAAGGVNLAASTSIADGASLTTTGSSGGAGGSIETSGAQLSLGAADVTAGIGGSWVLDPTSLTIGTAAAGAIGSALNSGSAVTEQTSANGVSDGSGKAGTAAGPGDITVIAPISWSSAAKLTLSAYNNIDIDADITATRAGSLVLTTGNNSGGSSATGTAVNFAGGAIQFTDQGKGALIINGSAYGLIWTAAQFAGMNSRGKYALAENFNASGNTYDASLYNNTFTGVFNGLGNSISNLTIDNKNSTDVGLFAVIDPGAFVENLALINASITSNNNPKAVGALAGVNKGTIENSSASGAVSARSTVTREANQADVGGLVGLNSGGTIADSYATDTVFSRASAYPGGGSYIGGLVGRVDGRGAVIVEDYATGAVSGYSRSLRAGGLIGELNFGKVQNCYATGNVSAMAATNGLFGGFVGYDGPADGRGIGGTISDSYATGQVSSVGESPRDGGFAGDVAAKITDSYWDTTTSGLSSATGRGSSSGITGLTTDALAKALPSGFSSGEWGNVDGQSTPYLLPLSAVDQPVHFATGSAFLKDNPSLTNASLAYVVQSAAGLEAINNNLAGNYALVTDINEAGFDATPIGESNPFTGIFDGLGNNIANLTIDDPTDAYVGLFGQIGANGVVENVGLSDANITDGITSFAVGALAAFNKGTIKGSFASGAVNSTGYYALAGGLAGYNSGGTIADDYATDSVTASGNNGSVGGLLGINDGTIEQSFATGAVSGTGGAFSHVGGLLGAVGGRDSKITNAYWNITTSGQSKGVGVVFNDGSTSGVTGLTTDTLASALPAGFSSGSWGDVNGQSTPYLLALSGSSQPVYFATGSTFLKDNPSLTNASQVYVVRSAAGLQDINDDLAGNYALGMNIDAADFAFSPIGGSSGFTGIFDGLGNSISNLTISDSSDTYVGLFGLIGSAGVVQNITLTDADIIGDGNNVLVGALAGRNNGTVIDSAVSGTVTGAGRGADAGGLVGFSSNISTITRSAVDDAVTVAGYDANAGGLAAYSAGTIDDSYAGGAVTAAGSNLAAGGLVGNNVGTVMDSFAAGAVSGAGDYANVGGFVGYNSGTINHGNATGLVAGSGINHATGGFAGYNAGTFTGSYWDITTSKQTNGVGEGSSVGVRGYASLPAGTALPTGFSAKVWGDDGGQSTPYLLRVAAAADQTVYFDTGSAFLKDNPTLTDASPVHLVQHVQGLQAINDDLAGNYALATNIDATGSTFTPIGASSPFTGIFDGLGNDIANLTIDDSTSFYVGLFGQIGAKGVVEKVGLSGADITGRNAYTVGALVASNDGTVEDSFASGVVTSTGGRATPVGGLVGINSGKIVDDYATDSVAGSGSEAFQGGLVGYNYGTIRGSFATGAVAGPSSSSSIGGFAGYNVGNITNSYWDITTSGKSKGLGQGDSSGVTGLTTDALASALPAGFSASTWGDVKGQSTPYLLALSDFNQPVYFGTGSTYLQDNPSLTNADLAYVVQSAAGLQSINDDLAGDYALARNIDAAGYAFSPIGQSGGFTGIFDGLGNSISNLTIDDLTDANIGLFGIIGSTGLVENVGLLGGSVTGGAGATVLGALAGYDNGTVKNVYETAAVTDSAAGRRFEGGLVGWATGDAITNSAASGTVTAAGNESDVGGLVGFAVYDNLSNDYATGAVSSTGDHADVGGLVGNSETTIANSYSTGAVAGTGAGSLVGGLIGVDNGFITASYWDTQTSERTKGVGEGISLGVKGLTTDALASALPAGFSASTWGDAGGQSTPYLTALSFLNQPVYFGTGSTFLQDNPSLTNDTVVYAVQSAAGLQAIDSDLAGAYAQVDDIYGTNAVFSPIGETTPFTGIFDGLGKLILKLTINEPTDSYVGLFGQIGASGVVENVGLRVTNVTGGNASASVGGLAGLNDGTITHSSAYGTVIGTGAQSVAGGLVGWENGGSITDSFATNTVKGVAAAGGLVGKQTKGTLENDFATGAVTGTFAGGLVGQLDVGTLKNDYATGSVSTPAVLINVAGGLVGYIYAGTVADSYSAGAVRGFGAGSFAGGFAGYNNGALTNCAWDITTSGQTKGVGAGNNAGLTGYTTAHIPHAIAPGANF